MDGTVAIEGVPDDWTVTPDQQEVVISDPGHSAKAVFAVSGLKDGRGRIEPIEVVVRGEGWERRIPAEVLVAASALAREAESADEMIGKTEIIDIPDASARRAVAFTGLGELAFDADRLAGGTYSLWLRARWEPKVAPRFFLKLPGGSLREIRPQRLFGFRDWNDPASGFTKGFLHHPAENDFGHWAWYRVPEVEVPDGGYRLTLAAEAGAYFDAVLLLPQTDELDRAGMNLFHNWNYCAEMALRGRDSSSTPPF